MEALRADRPMQIGESELAGRRLRQGAEAGPVSKRLEAIYHGEARRHRQAP